MDESIQRYISQVDLEEIKKLKQKLRFTELQHKVLEQEYTILILRTFIKNRMSDKDCFDEETGLIKQIEQ